MKWKPPSNKGEKGKKGKNPTQTKKTCMYVHINKIHAGLKYKPHAY
jgi:hypothetical protein